MNVRAWHIIASVLLSASVAVAACSDDESSELSSGNGAGTTTAQGGDPGTGGSGGSLGVGAGTPCDNTCSSDLKRVIDCNGNVAETCPGNQACLNGACSDDPCGAAAASKSSFGCDYWAVRPDVISVIEGACFAAYVANTWSDPVHIDVFLNDQPIIGSFIHIPQGQGPGLTYVPYDANTGLAPGEVAIVFLSHNDPGAFLPTCPFPAAVNTNSQANPWVAGTGVGTAFNIRTDRPIVAYTILPYGGGPSQATSASLLLPTSAWDDNYVAVNAYEKSQLVAQAQPSLNILAQADNTTVTVLPKVPIVGGNGVTPAPANTAATYTINKGQYLQLSQDAELTGSVISADQPIGVWGGASCLNVPSSAGYCDSAHQQIPPVKALGTRYAMVRHRNRFTAPSEEAPPWRLVGAVDGTQLSWQPSSPPGAPSALNQGDVFEFQASGPYFVESQDADHPFYAAQYMTGSETINSGEGDPEWVNVIPVDQYLDFYVFFTDPTYAETSLVVTRRRSTQNGMFADVSIDCGGTLSGWTPLGADLEWTRVDLVTGNFQGVNGCENGRHEMSSDVPFGVTVWGWGTTAAQNTTYVSYAYPAGASVQPINEVVVPPTPK